MEHLQTFVVVVGFIGAKPSKLALRPWLAQLQTQVSGTLTLGRNLGWGFFSIKTSDAKAVRDLLLLSYRTSVGLCIFQRWIADFNPAATRGVTEQGTKADRGLKISTWITLCHLKDELRGVAQQIAEGIGELIGAAVTNIE
jgi:hypothetical protein